MAVVTLNQNVANSPTNSYPVGVFKQANGTELQAIVNVDSSGNEYDALNPLPVTGTFTPTAPSLPTLTPSRVSCPSATSTEVLAANTSRVAGGMIINNTDSMFYLQIAAAAATGEGVPLSPGATYQVNTKQQIRAIQTSGGALSLDVYEST